MDNLDNKGTTLTISFNGHCFEKLSVVDYKAGESFLYRVDGIEVNEEEWKAQQEQDVSSPPAMATIQIR